MRRLADGTIERSTVIPVLNLKLDSRTEQDAAGMPTAFSGQAFNAAGDTARGIFRLEIWQDSTRLTAGRGETLIRRAVPLQRPDGILPAQSLGAIADVGLRAAGRDTVFRYLPMGLDSAVPVSVRHVGDTIVISTSGVDARMLRGSSTVRIPAQNVVAEVWNGVDSLPPFAGMRPPVPNYDAPAGASYTAEPVRVMIRPTSGDTFTLAGTLTIPKTGRRPFPAVVMMSGSGQQDRDETLWPITREYRPFREYAERLAAEGIAVLRYDDRTAGESGGSVGGTTADYTDDVRQLVAWLRARPDIDPARIGLAGHSEGGVMGPLLASDDARIAAVVVLAGPSKRGLDVLRDQFLWPLRTLPAAERERRLPEVERDLQNWLGANPWTRWFGEYDPLPVARRLRMPVLIQHGALDRQVSVGQADTLAAAIRAGGNRDVTVKIYPRLNHLFLPTDGDGSPSEYAGIEQQTLPREVLDDTATWLAARLRPR